ncbi:HlyD family efflux transporter periplasmic adaptor subunit [Massilia pinisoli]|uniref:HlyD family efflux transporter periplasmic adaptor subunit n=1 Tax=Massilia pinisoli TaxID=1772194 RepID=A0ABT1ZUR4_9BURK|nr:HlyD family efflux transporter periplasmic adaptor subunit [Massilia pinisoli]MCS0583599.1 HlyD family efflux transporter periplasmic adaptor subunit [Massilia pinisoli]
MSNIEVPNSLLFRREATASLGQQWLGTIHLAQPLSSWLISGLAFVILLAFITFVLVGTITKKARVTGILVPGKGSLVINAPNAGVLVRTYITEGQRVRAGEPLFELSTERQGSRGELTALIAQQLKSRTSSLETERRLRLAQNEERKTVLTQRLQSLNAEANQLAQETELIKRRLALAQQTLRKYETLQASGYFSAAQTQQQEEAVIDLSTRLANEGRTAAQLRATRLEVEGELVALATSLATDLAQLQRAQASLEQEIAENNSRKSVLITAPQDGKLTTITYQAGQAINGGQTLATLIPMRSDNADGATELEVHLYAPSRTAGFVARGQNVLIRYQAFPYQKFGLQKGIVIDVSATPFAPNELPQNLASTILTNAQQNAREGSGGEALYRIKVRPEKQTIQAYGRSQYLKPGMTLEADVMQDSRKIWEWIAEPLLAIAK